jgi:hypothetical protein
MSTTRRAAKKIKFQNVIAGRRDPEPKPRTKPKRRQQEHPGRRLMSGDRNGVFYGANGPGGWRPDPADPASYRYAGSTVVARYAVVGDAQPTDSVTNKGAGTIGNVDLELLFWGNQWWSATGPTMNEIIGAVQQLLASPYLSALTQYGFGNVNLRSATLVSQPAPGVPTFSADAVRNMVWALIDDNVFPEPDEAGGKIIYMVFAPNGSRYNDSGARGAHSTAHDTDLFDSDDAWVGWIDNGDLDYIIDVFSHELVEALTDPGPDDGWLMNRNINGGNEIGDACNGTADRLDGLLVQAYWSEQDKACVIPWHGYSAWMTTGSTVLQTSTVDSGKSEVSPGPCFPKGTYEWWVQQHVQRDTFTVNTGHFSSPAFSWKLAGTPVTGTGALPVANVATTHPTVAGDGAKPQTITLHYHMAGNQLIVTNTPSDGNFAYAVEATVTDLNGASKRTKRVLANGGWMQGQDLVWDDAYTTARESCWAKLRDAAYRLVERAPWIIDKGDPPPPWVDRLPDHLRGADRIAVQQIESLAHYVKSVDAATAKNLKALSRRYGVAVR